MANECIEHSSGDKTNGVKRRIISVSITPELIPVVEFLQVTEPKGFSGWIRRKLREVHVDRTRWLYMSDMVSSDT